MHVQKNQRKMKEMIKNNKLYIEAVLSPNMNLIKAARLQHKAHRPFPKASGFFIPLLFCR